jgi:serine/threonine protein kinase
VQRGTLSKLIKKFDKERLPIELAVFYTAEIVQTLEYLHGRGIIHRDLKPQNILITSDFHLKIVSIELNLMSL